MGIELSCTLHHNGKTSSGTALLETAELLFRGETRLKIAFSAMKKVQAQKGELHVHTKDGVAIFAIGLQAEKWCQKILHPKSLLDKLGVKPGDEVALIGKFPAEFLGSLRKHGARLCKPNSPNVSPWRFLLADSREALSEVKSAAKSLRDSAALWIVYPKGEKQIMEGDVFSAGHKAGLVDIKVASFSSTHTALKFVLPKSKR